MIRTMMAMNHDGDDDNDHNADATADDRDEADCHDSDVDGNDEKIMKRNDKDWRARILKSIFLGTENNKEMQARR